MSAFINDDHLIDGDMHEQQIALLDKNWQTTAAVAVAVGTGGVTGALMLSAFPAQTLVTGATIGGLAYAGHRRSEGLDPIPFVSDLLKKSDKQAEPEEAPAAEAAAA